MRRATPAFADGRYGFDWTPPDGERVKVRKITVEAAEKRAKIRLWQHQRAPSKTFTGRYNVHHLVYYEHFPEPTMAIARENQLKNWRRSKKATAMNALHSYWQDISPLHNIRKGQPPAAVFVGSNDKLLPGATVKAFEKQMIDAGNECESHIYEGENHGFFHINKGGRKLFEEVMAKADAFLVKHGYLTGGNNVAEWTAKAVANQKTQSPKQ